MHMSRYKNIDRRYSLTVYLRSSIVPHVPFEWLGFIHTTREVFYPHENDQEYRVCSASDGEDPGCSNECGYFGCRSIVDHLIYLNISLSHVFC